MPAFFHRTTLERAHAIVADGFVDGSATDCGFDRAMIGVWLSDVPVDAQEGASMGALLLVSIDASDAELAEYEVVEEGRTYREWMIPAQLLNARASVRFATDEEESAGDAERMRRAMRIIESLPPE